MASTITTRSRCNLRHAFSYGLQAQFHYTWSHDLGTIALREIRFNLSNSYGSLGFDNRHQFAGRSALEPTLQGIKQGCERVDQRLDSGFQDVPVQRRSLQRDRQQDRYRCQLFGSTHAAGGSGGSERLRNHCNASNSIGTPCLPKTAFATYPGSGVSAPIQTDWGNIAPNSFRGPATSISMRRCSEPSPSRRSLSSLWAFRLTTFSTTRTSPILRVPLHRAPLEQSPALSARPPAFTVRAKALRFRTPDGFHGDVFVLGNAIHCGDGKGRAFGSRPFHWCAEHV